MSCLSERFLIHLRLYHTKVVFKSKMKVLKTMAKFDIVNPITDPIDRSTWSSFLLEIFAIYTHTQIRVYRETRDEGNGLGTANVMVFKRGVF